jgi:hypothetical protein
MRGCRLRVEVVAFGDGVSRCRWFIQFKGEPMEVATGVSVPDGTMAVFVDPDGQIVAILKVEGGGFSDLTNVPYGVLDSSTEHTEVRLEVVVVPPDSDKMQTMSATTTKICRDKLGNIVKCPPR